MLEAIEGSVGGLDIDSCRNAINNILNNPFERIDLEVLAYNLQIRLYKGDYYPDPFFKVPEDVRLTDQEIITGIKKAVSEAKTDGFLKAAIIEYLLFRERSEVGGIMLQQINTFRYDDYPTDLPPDSPFLGPEYQKMIRKMMAGFEGKQWLGCLGKVVYDVPSSDERAQAVYGESTVSDLTVEQMKDRAMSRQLNYEYQTPAYGLDESSWNALQHMYNIMYFLFDQGPIDRPKMVMKVNEITWKRKLAQDLHSEINMMTEPFAKLVAQMVNGGNASTVEIQRDLFGGGYSWLLTTPTEENLSRREKLLKSMEKMIRSGDMAIMNDFLAAKSFSRQLFVLGFSTS